MFARSWQIFRSGSGLDFGLQHATKKSRVTSPHKKVRSVCLKFLKLVRGQMFQLCFFSDQKVDNYNTLIRALVDWPSNITARIRVLWLYNDYSSFTFSWLAGWTLGYTLACGVCPHTNFLLTLHCSTAPVLMFLVCYIKQNCALACSASVL